MIETIINKSEAIKVLKKNVQDGELNEKVKKELTAEEKVYKYKRNLVEEKLSKF